jgi:S1-C subfamily serine protease
MAGLVGADSISDLAVLRMDGKWPHTLRLRRGSVRAGELCLAVGNPLGRYPETVTIGVVSGLARTAVAGPGRPHYRLLQTDCDIHEGNSGGPLVDMRGRVIGVNTLIDAETPYIGLSIPVSTVAPVLAELLAHGRVARASLGVSVARRTRALGDSSVTGLEVVRLRRTRGQVLKVGDLILRIGRRDVTDPPSLFDELGRNRVGVPTELTVLRDGQRMVVTVRPWEYKDS